MAPFFYTPIKDMTERTSKPRRSRKKAKVEVVAEAPDVKVEKAEVAPVPEPEAVVAETEEPVVSEKETELHFGSSYESEIDEIIEEEVAKAEPESLIVIPLTGVLEITAPEPEPEPEPEAAPVVQPKTPATYANPDGGYIANSFKRRRAMRRQNR